MPGNGRVLVTFLPRYKVFWKNFSQPKLYIRGKTGQVIFLNACKITTVIQTTDNNCEGQGLVGGLMHV